MSDYWTITGRYIGKEIPSWSDFAPVVSRDEETGRTKVEIAYEGRTPSAADLVNMQKVKVARERNLEENTKSVSGIALVLLLILLIFSWGS